MPKRIGIIGIGKMGVLHGALLKKLPGIEIVAMADTSPFVIHAFKSFLPSIAYFSSYKEMFEKAKLDAVVIATPSSTHVPMALAALEYNLDLFIEKPLSNTFTSAQTLYKKLQGTSNVSLVGYCLRYMPPFQKAKQRIDAQVIGKVVKIESEMFISDVSAPQSGWRYDPTKSGGGVVIDFTVHMIDLLYWFFGRPEAVSATTKKLYSLQVEDEAEITFSYPAGVEAVIKSSWSSPEHRKSYAKIRIIGERGEIIVTDQTLEQIVDGVHTKESYAQMYDGYFFDIGGPNYSLQMQTFAKALVSRTNPEADVTAGLTVQYLVSAIYDSAKEGRHITLAYDF
jgi:scyllo-inositol 2-dehydrogenase (NADP+)